MIKHTSGPWVVRHEFNVFDESGRLVASCGGHTSNFREVESENRANAALIADAPALLDMIETMLALESVAPQHDDITADAIALLRKHGRM